MKKSILTMLLLMVASCGFAQRFTDKIDRGLVVVPGRSGGNFVSWRVFGEEYYDVTYNLYRDRSKIASELSASNFQDASGNSSSTYYVIPVVKGVEKTELKSKDATCWSAGYKQIDLVEPVDRNGNTAGSYYQVNDVSVGDLTGNGVVEFIVKRPCSDNDNTAQKVRFNHIDCYDMDGNRLWWIDMGPNMCSGPDEQWDAVCYDWDEDGKAEVLLRLEDGAIIHYNGGTLKVGDMNVDTRNRVGNSPLNYTSAGNEYLLYLEGATGKPYQIGPAEHPDYMDYPLKRLETEEFDEYIDWANQSAYSEQIGRYNAKLVKMWGDSYGHRSTKHYWGAPFLDGRHASIFLGRGAYTQHKFIAFNVDRSTHKLTQIQDWFWKNNAGDASNVDGSNPWYGNGYHNFAIGDVDWDGRDEIIFGSMVIDDNGKGLSTTGFGHGDAQHCSDFDPYRHGEEQFTCQEEGYAHYGGAYRNATTSEIYVKQDAGGDTGRGLMGNFTNTYPGSIGRTSSTNWISSVADKELEASFNSDPNSFIDWSDLNARIYWDGDLLDEFMDSPGEAKQAIVYKPGTYSRLVTCEGSLANSSKNNAGVLGDIMGDWREELVLRYGDNALVIYTTNYPTEYRIPTLWHDHQYRNAMVWQSMGYNQPPHKSYFLGEMEDITVAPPPYTMTGRTEVKNGGTIGTTDEHLLVCETQDSEVTIENGASPYIVTFNVPSWVQGTAQSNVTTKVTPINTIYYTCTVKGGALTGSTRLIKQGDGILTLPAVDMTYMGETNIWAGTVNFNGSAANTGVWLNRFGKLNTAAATTTFKGLKADYGSVVSPGGKDAVGTIVADTAYYMGFGSRLVLDLYSDGLKADQFSTKKLTVEKKTWNFGPQYLMPVIQVVEHMNSGESTLAEGKYLIGHADEMEGNLASIKIEGVTDLKMGLERDETGNIYLVLGSVRGASEIVWTGSQSGIWDYATSENFYVASDESKTADVFVAGDNVNFTDEANSFTVTLADGAELQAGDILVDNSTNNYTIKGNGKIVSGTFYKEGTGTLTMGGDNTYTGGNHLKGGIVKVSSLGNSTQAYGNLGAPTVSANLFTLEDGATLQTTASVRNGSSIKTVGEAGGCIQNGYQFTQERAITGTGLTKAGAGTFDMQGRLNAEKLTVTAGTFNYATNTYAKPVFLEKSGALTGSGFISCPINVAEGAKAALTTTQNTYSNEITGTGQITIKCATQKGGSGNSTYYATRTPLNFDLTEFEGTIVVGATNDEAASNGATGRVFSLNSSQGAAKATFDIPENFFVLNTGNTYRIGKVTGKGALGGRCSFSNDSWPSSVNTWQVGTDEDFTFIGFIDADSKFEKLGTGTMTASGKWTTTSSVNVKEGNLYTTGTLGTGALTVAAGATLSGKASLTNSSFTINGTIQPDGNKGNNTSYQNYIDFGGKNLSLKTTSKLAFALRKSPNVNKDGVITSYYNTRISNIGTLTIPAGATIALNMPDNYQMENLKPAAGETEKVTTFYIWTDVQNVSIADGVNYEMCDLLFGEWDLSRINEGIVSIRVTADGYNDFATGISDIESSERVRVTVVTLNGALIEEFSCPMSNVKSAFANTSVPKGIYLLRIKSETGKTSTMKIQR